MAKYVDGTGLSRIWTKIKSLISTHTERTDNPHSVTKDQIGLGNVANVESYAKTETYTKDETISAVTNDLKKYSNIFNPNKGSYIGVIANTSIYFNLGTAATMIPVNSYTTGIYFCRVDTNLKLANLLNQSVYIMAYFPELDIHESFTLGSHTTHTCTNGYICFAIIMWCPA